MINSTQKLWGMTAVAILCFASSAFANSGSLTMTSAGNNVMHGVQRAEPGPRESRGHAHRQDLLQRRWLRIRNGDVRAAVP